MEESPRAAPKLNARQRVFVEKYLTSWCQTSAAREAGYAHPGPAAVALMRKPQIREAITARMHELHESTNEFMLRLSQQARNEGAAYYRKDGSVDLPRLIADGKQHLIKGTHWDRNGNLVVEFYDKQRAEEMLGRCLGIFNDKLALTDPSGQKEFGSDYRESILSKLDNLEQVCGTETEIPSGAE